MPKKVLNQMKSRFGPLILKLLFNLAQDQMKNSQLVRRENIEFAFTKIMTCDYCKCGYISEEDLIKQLQKQIDKLDFKKLSVQDKIKGEIKKFKKFQMIATDKNQNIDVSDVDVKDYIKFLLKEGDDQEKRELLTCLNGRIVLKNKMVNII